MTAVKPNLKSSKDVPPEAKPDKQQKLPSAARKSDNPSAPTAGKESGRGRAATERAGQKRRERSDDRSISPKRKIASPNKRMSGGPAPIPAIASCIELFTLGWSS